MTDMRSKAERTFTTVLTALDEAATALEALENIGIIGEYHAGEDGSGRKDYCFFEAVRRYAAEKGKQLQEIMPDKAFLEDAVGQYNDAIMAELDAKMKE